ncbi:hypothetical protein PV518_21185 [Streptomyces sp. ND04-05B]|uniref:hypothetical protein n=1 Tax=Streptomyces sp. ND04-05B TaxID=3028693 RepID=UPI0029AB146D|nr:hypothetical protein [Streptomyces sp. ND04-05B]MDX3064656.1 hypothetical protein [Streptomyces sp. ND04-05B]
MDEYNSHDLDSARGLSALNSAIAMGSIEPKVAADLLRGHPCEEEFLTRFPGLRDCTEPPDDAPSSD